MSLHDQALGTYLASLSARSSTPGGGAAAAVSGAQAAALMGMVAEFSDKTMDQAQRSEVLSVVAKAKEQFVSLADLDAQMFAELMASYRAKSGVQDALKGAAQAPLSCLELSVALIPFLDQLKMNGNTNLVTDTGIAASLLKSTIEASEMNVRINLRSITDEDFVRTAKAQLESARSQLPFLDQVVTEVLHQLD